MERRNPDRRDLDHGAPDLRKKTYRPPELVEWGTILDLTQGIKAGFEDGFGKGGTQPS